MTETDIRPQLRLGEDSQHQFKQSRMLFADEMETDAPIDALDMPKLKSFYEMHYRELISELAIDRDQFLRNAKLASGDRLTLAGLLIFAANPQAYRPSFSVTCTSFEGVDKSSVVYRDKQSATGVLSQQHRDAVSFVTRNLRRIQPRGDGFNAPGVLEIPHEALVEAVANALVHRDYFINTPCAIEIYDNRVEFTSPGSLPNTVNGENIRFGIHIERNPIILSFLERDREFAYSGRGSGIPRIMSLCAKAGVGVSFVDEKESERFRIVFERVHTAGGGGR